jgi:hypothetical protein
VARKKDKSAVEIQRLLEDRRRIEQWLQRLAMAADKTPPAVRERVQGDYETRLTAVVEELKGYADDLQGSLSELHGRRDECKAQERAATEELAEAELRHAVGEFGEAEWREKKGAILERLIAIREGLAESEEEIAELEEVLDAVEAPPAPPEPAPAAAPSRTSGAHAVPHAAAESRLSLGSELGLRDLGRASPPSEPPPPLRVERRPEPPAEAEATASAGGERFGDELAFLKAVTDEKQPAEAPRRPGPAKPAVEKASELPAVGQSRPSAINQRTLKCGECGAMNLPTEWYCDRCGAELAAL